MKQGETLFGIWGGIRRMARDLNRAASTVHGWKKEGRIPAEKQPHVLEVGLALGLPITADHVVFPLGRPAADASGISEQASTVCFNQAGKMKRAGEA